MSAGTKKKLHFIISIINNPLFILLD